MIRIAEQVSRAIRILRGNRDESARASHLVVKKELFVYNESLLGNQAEREKFFQSTFFERKIMSTKTAFKRVALIAAAALAIGGISAVSANAAGPYAAGADWTITNAYAVGTPVVAATSTETATQIAGPANYVTLTVANTGTTTPSAYTGTYFTITGGATTSGATSGTVAPAGSVNIATPTVGTITVSSYQIIGGAAFTTATTVATITVTASVPGTVYASSNVYGNAGLTVGTSATDSAFSVTQPAGTASVANFNVSEVDANGVALTTGFKGITATSTNGLLTASGGITSSSTTYIGTTPTNAVTNFVLSGIAGLSGTSVVTISVNGVVAKTYSVIFTGVAAKIVATLINPVIAVGTAAAAATAGITANTLAIKVQEFDANGNALVVPALTVTPVSVATVSASAVTAAVGTFADGSLASTTAVGLNLTGVAAGTTMVTVTDGTLVSAPVSIRVSSGTPTAVVYTTDAATYPAGGAGMLTVTVSDAAGTLPAGVYTLATGTPISSLAFAVAPANLNAVVTLNDMGVSTKAFNAPLSDGAVTVNGTATTAVTSTGAKFTVTSGASDAANAAVDAANEATDAANAATDAANAAADSADAATQAAQDAGDKADAALAAVTALSQQVTNVLAKLASLSATLSKIIKAIAKLPKK